MGRFTVYLPTILVDFYGKLGGGFKHFCFCHPEPWGFMIQFDLRIFLRWVVRCSTTN